MTLVHSVREMLLRQQKIRQGRRTPGALPQALLRSSKGGSGKSAISANCNSSLRRAHSSCSHANRANSSASSRACGTLIQQRTQLLQLCPHSPRKRPLQPLPQPSQSGSRAKTNPCIQRSRFASISTSRSSISLPAVIAPKQQRLDCCTRILQSRSIRSSAFRAARRYSSFGLSNISSPPPSPESSGCCSANSRQNASIVEMRNCAGSSIRFQPRSRERANSPRSQRLHREILFPL